MDADLFVIIGVMKAGTTSLYQWLQAHPAVAAGGEKEPNFFVRSRGRTMKETDDYLREIGPTWQPGQLRGEASVIYSDPLYASVVARRMQHFAPRARLICVLRDPLDRARSHYRHSVLKGRERRLFFDALLEPGNLYVRRSMYGAGLLPYTEMFDSRQVLFLALEALSTDQGQAKVRAHLGLEPFEDEMPILNRSRGDRGTSPRSEGIGSVPALRWPLSRSQRHGLPFGEKLPLGIRRWAKRGLSRPQNRFAHLLNSAATGLPAEVEDLLRPERAVMAKLLQGDGVATESR